MLSTWNSRYVRKRNAYRAEQACSGKAWLDVKSLREGQNLFVLVGRVLNKLDVCFWLGNNYNYADDFRFFALREKIDYIKYSLIIFTKWMMFKTRPIK